MPPCDLFEIDRRKRGRIEIARGEHVVDHALQTEPGAVFRRVDAGHAVGVQLRDFRRHDHAAAAAEHLDVRAAALAQQIEHVLEKLDVAALVRTDGDALHVLVECCGDDLVDRAVVAEMNDLRAARLQYAAHDVDRRVVTVKEAGGGDEAYLVPRRTVALRGSLLDAQISHNRRTLCASLRR